MIILQNERYSNILYRQKMVLLRDFRLGPITPGSPPPQPLEHSCKSTGPKKKKIKIPSHWPFRINQFLNGQCGGFSFFSIFRSGGLQECLAVSIGVKLPHKSWTPPYTIYTRCTKLLCTVLYWYSAFPLSDLKSQV